MANSALNHSWPALSKLWLKRWAFKRGKGTGSEQQAPATWVRAPWTACLLSCLKPFLGPPGAYPLPEPAPHYMSRSPMEHHRLVGSLLSRRKCLPRLSQDIVSGGKFAGGENPPPHAFRQPGGFLGSLVLFVPIAPRWLLDGGSAKGRKLEVPGVLVDTSLEHTHIGWWVPGPHGLNLPLRGLERPLYDTP